MEILKYIGARNSKNQALSYVYIFVSLHVKGSSIIKRNLHEDSKEPNIYAYKLFQRTKLYIIRRRGRAR